MTSMAATITKPNPWTPSPITTRIAVLRRFRQLVAERADAFVQALANVSNRTDSASLAGELIPLLDAAGFLQRRARRLLAAKALGRLGRPFWLFGIDASIHREPHGRVLIIAPSNYPLFLAGSQCLAALVAGNRVTLKPAPGCAAVAELLRSTLIDCGLEQDALELIDPDPRAAMERLSQSDFVVFTGSHRAGRRVMRAAALHGLPGIYELSGCDAMLVLRDADLSLAARCVKFGLTFNASQTCIAPRRIIVEASVAERFILAVSGELRDAAAYAVSPSKARQARELIDDCIESDGRIIIGRLDEHSMTPTILESPAAAALLKEDILAPICGIVRVRDETAAIAVANDCRYRLGASIFGSPKSAKAIAARLNVGSVVINDLIAPTADPRLPFGGHGDSGHGVTRGAEGLLAMTRIKTVSTRVRGPRPHLLPDSAAAPDVLKAQLQATHGTLVARRLHAVVRLARLGRAAWKAKGAS